MRPTDPDDRVPWERLLPAALVIWAIVLGMTLACAEPLNVRRCAYGWEYIDRVDTAGWVTRANGDTLPITFHWQGCFQPDTNLVNAWVEAQKR